VGLLHSGQMIEVGRDVDECAFVRILALSERV
jgi:hypothetical protein